MQSILTQADVARLLTDDSPDSRTAILEKVATGYNADQFAEREREVAEQIFRLLMRDVTIRVRETLAEQVKANDQIPRDIALHLAHDVESVAIPILQNSNVLSDADLVNVVESSRDLNKLLAITKRDTVSLRVSDALVETNYGPVVSSLLSNERASISQRAFEKILDDFKNDEKITEALVQHHNLPVTVVERLISTASEAVAKELTDKYHIDDSQVSRKASHAREDFMLRLLEGELPLEEIEALVSQMAAEERLTHSLIMTALCRGQLAFFTVAMARLSHISVSNAMRLVADRGVHGFIGLYEKSGLPASMFDAIRLLLRAVQQLEQDTAIPGSMLYANRLVERVVSMAGDQYIEYLPYFIALIRQNVHR